MFSIKKAWNTKHGILRVLNIYLNNLYSLDVELT